MQQPTREQMPEEGRNSAKHVKQVGDILSFRDADNTALRHGHDVIGFDENGNPQVECDGKTLTVTPEQIRAVYKKSEAK